MPLVRLQHQMFDPGAEHNVFLATTQGRAGALVTFTGVVRSDPNDPLVRMEVDHFPDLAQAEISRLVDEACARFELIDAMVIHRFGSMHPGEPIMQVSVLSQHRSAAFSAADFLMDYLKSGAPFWKKEVRASGEHWVDAKPQDELSLSRW